jgi:hypothetical protein
MFSQSCHSGVFWSYGFLSRGVIWLNSEALVNRGFDPVNRKWLDHGPAFYCFELFMRPLWVFSIQFLTVREEAIRIALGHVMSLLLLDTLSQEAR